MRRTVEVFEKPITREGSMGKARVLKVYRKNQIMVDGIEYVEEFLKVEFIGRDGDVSDVFIYTRKG